MLYRLPLVVLFPSSFEKVYLAWRIIEPIENRRVVGASRIEQRILSFDVFNQEALVLDWIEKLKKLKILGGYREMNRSPTLIVLLQGQWREFVKEPLCYFFILVDAC